MKVWLSTEIELFYIGGSMKRLDISRAVHGLAERRRGRSKATDAARSTGHSSSIAGTANRQGAVVRS